MRGTFCYVLTGVSTMTKVARSVPIGASDGSNSTVMLQLAPAPKVEPHVVPETRYQEGKFCPILAMPNAALPLLVSLTVA